MSNNRIYYASQTAQLRPQDAEGTSLYPYWYQPLGLQSVSMSTSFDLQQAFQLGTVELYDNVENVPNVEVTLNRVIDNTTPLYAMCMGGENGADGANAGQSLGSLVNNRVNFRLGIFSDTQQYVSSNASSHVICSGMYLSRFNYTIPVEGNGTEEITLVGNHKIWNTGSFTGQSSYTFTAASIFNPSTTVGSIKPTQTSGILTRQFVNLASSTLPLGAGGIRRPNGAAGALPHIQNITIGADLGRENINQLGRFSPYCRYTTFPVEVTSEFQVVTTDGDKVDLSDFRNSDFCGTSHTNLVKHSISIRLNTANTTNVCNNYMTLNLGNKNTLTSVNYTGGDTGGGNATVTYSFRNFNDFNITTAGTFANGIAISVGSGGGVSALSDNTPTDNNLVNLSEDTITEPNYSGDNNNVE